MADNLFNYAAIKAADDDLGAAAWHLNGLAEGILAESAQRNVDGGAVMSEYTDHFNKIATDWINSNYRIHEFLADAYGKTWLPEAAKPMFEAVCKASTISDPEVKASLKEAMSLITIAAVAMTMHTFFSAAKGAGAAEAAAAETATRNAVEATAAAKTYILGL